MLCYDKSEWLSLTFSAGCSRMNVASDDQISQLSGVFRAPRLIKILLKLNFNGKGETCDI